MNPRSYHRRRTVRARPQVVVGPLVCAALAALVASACSPSGSSGPISPAPDASAGSQAVDAARAVGQDDDGSARAPVDGGAAPDAQGRPDDVPGAADDVPGAIDDVTGAADDVLGAIDDVTGAADDVTEDGGPSGGGDVAQDIGLGSEVKGGSGGGTASSGGTAGDDVMEPDPIPTELPPPMQVTDTGSGLDRVVSVEVPGQVRIGFEAAMGYGPTQWFDLVTDPEATRDICQYPDVAADVTEQGSLANHVFYPEDYHAHHLSQKLWHPDLPRSATVVEQSALRVVVETSSFPTVNHEATTDIELRTRYVLYPDGRVAIRSTVVPTADHWFSEWRVAVLGVGDPTYKLVWEEGAGAVAGPGGTLLVPGAAWPPDRWAGYAVQQPGWHTFPILASTPDTLTLGGNTAQVQDGAWTIASQDSVFGWIRGIDSQDPFVWTDKPVRYLTLRWDPATPPPNTQWASASAVMSAWRENGQAYEADLHGWDGFKRHYVRIRDVTFVTGQPVVQRFLLRVGATGSAVLPDLAKATTSAKATWDWLDPSGRLMGPSGPLPFDPDELAWTLPAGPGTAALTATQRVDHPVVRLPGAAGVSSVVSGGQPLLFRTADAADGTLLLLIWHTLAPGQALTLTLW